MGGINADFPDFVYGFFISDKLHNGSDANLFATWLIAAILSGSTGSRCTLRMMLPSIFRNSTNITLASDLQKS
jgi:hypothetical protein